MSERRLHAFDLDNTLIPGSLVVRAFWRLANAGYMRLTDERLAQLAKERQTHEYPDGHLSDNAGPYIASIVRAYIDGTRQMRMRLIRKTAAALAEEDARRVYTEMREVLSEAKKGRNVAVIVSGSPDHFVQPVARALGVSVASGSRFYRSGGAIHPTRIQGNRGDNKHLIVGRMADLYGAHPYSAYGDSMPDLTMLQLATYPYAVNPTHELRAVAQAHGWPIIECRG